MILFIGQMERGFMGHGAFQEVDYRRMFGGIAKWVAEIDSLERIPEIVSKAFGIAKSGRPGPVVISLLEDVLFDTREAADAAAVSMQNAKTRENRNHIFNYIAEDNPAVALEQDVEIEQKADALPSIPRVPRRPRSRHA